MPRVPERLTFPILILTSGALLGVAIKEVLDRREGKQRAKIPLHNPKAFTLEVLAGIGRPSSPSSSSSSSVPSSSSSTK